MGTLTLFCGLPGSGKTTLARQLESEGRDVRLCTDEWQARLGVPHSDGAFHDRLQRLLYDHALDLLRAGTDVILEDGLWTRAERVSKLADARMIGAPVAIHIFDVPFDTLWSRLEQRATDGAAASYPMTQDDLRRAVSVFEPPTADELTGVVQWMHAEPRSRQP